MKYETAIAEGVMHQKKQSKKLKNPKWIAFPFFVNLYPVTFQLDALRNAIKNRENDSLIAFLQKRPCRITPNGRRRGFIFQKDGFREDKPQISADILSRVIT